MGLSYGHPRPRTGASSGYPRKAAASPVVQQTSRTPLWAPSPRRQCGSFLLFFTLMPPSPSLCFSVWVVSPVHMLAACRPPPFPGPHSRLDHLIQVMTTEPRFFFSSLGTPSLPNSWRHESRWLTQQQIFSHSSGGNWAAGLPGQPGEDTGRGQLRELASAANAANTLVMDFQLPERGENKCLSLKPPSLGSLVMVAPAN